MIRPCVWVILQEKVYKTSITDLEITTTMSLMYGCRNDDMIQFGSLRSMSLFYFVQITNAYIHTFSSNTRHTL